MNQDPQCAECIPQLGIVNGFVGCHLAGIGEIALMLNLPVIELSINALRLAGDMIATFAAHPRREQAAVHVFLDICERDACGKLIPQNMTGA